MPLSNSTSMKLLKKSLNEKGAAAATAVICVPAYFQIFQGESNHPPTNNKYTSVTGIKIFQPRRMIWSERKRGKVARIQMNMDTTRKVLIPSQIQPGIQLNNALSMGGSQPPRNISAARMEGSHMLAFSARKKIAKPMPEYSTIWPATISASPSTTSNGWRFVSATPEIRETRKMGSSGSQFQDRQVRPFSAAMPRPCPITISVRFMLPETMITTRKQKPMAIS